MESNVDTMWSLILSFVVVLSHSLQSHANDILNSPSGSSPLSLAPSWSSVQSQNFIGVSRSTGELVMALHLDDVSAIKRVVGNENGAQMIILQATDGRHLVHNIYDPMFNLRECKTTKNQDDIDDFRRSFHTKYTSGFLSDDIIYKPRPSQRSKSLSFTSNSINLEYVHNATESVEVFVLPRTTSSKGVNVHPSIRMMIDVMEARRVCRDMEKDLKAHLMMMTDQSRDGSRVMDDSEIDVGGADVEMDPEEEERSGRERRSIFIVPGTLWCGSGSIAKSYDDLGEHNTTDLCCREHDHCPHTILSWQNKFNIFNHRLYTLSDCECDVKFRDCLLQVNDSMSRAVGDAYFNFLGCACFQLEEEEECISRSWWPWNACSRYQEIKRAIVNFIGPVFDFMPM